MNRPASRVGRLRRVSTLVRAAAFAVAATAWPMAYASDHKVFALQLVNGALQEASNTIRVKQGDDVELRWTSDRPIALHLHGYDIESTLEAGKTRPMSFKATLPGRFPVEVHGAAKGAHRPVLYLEVYP